MDGWMDGLDRPQPPQLRTGVRGSFFFHCFHFSFFHFFIFLEFCFDFFHFDFLFFFVFSFIQFFLFLFFHIFTFVSPRGPPLGPPGPSKSIAFSQ